MSVDHILFLCLAALIAGAINSIAGGGTLLSFPALVLAGVPALIANATNTVALVPGSFSAFWKYRDTTEGSGLYWLWLGLPSLVGGVVGALLAVKLGDKQFERLVPWLVLAATILFIVQNPLRKLMLGRNTGDLTDTKSPLTLAGVMLFQLVIAIYGGFFGAGIGILMLASLGFLGIKSIHKMNGLKNLSAVFINGAASLTFAYKKEVDWRIAVIMGAAAIVGGYTGAAIAQKIPDKTVRIIIICIGIAVATKFFLSQWLSLHHAKM
jgi:uncharacterized membrane protein YfcA